MFQYSLDNKRYHTLNYHYKEKYHDKVIKVSLNAGFTCPNIDGKVGYGGCIYCSKSGSGDFGGDISKSLSEQFDEIKDKLSKKWPRGKYIAYFQAHTNTYAPLSVLKEKYESVLKKDNVIGIAIATRPDAIEDEVLDYLEELNKNTDVTVELGLQTIHEDTAKLINRCHSLNQFEEMVHSGKTVLVEFSAPWCVYCRRLAPSLESVAEEYKDTLVFTAVNIDDEPELAEAEAIEVVPTLLIYHSGQTLGSIVAPESRTQLVAFIEETLQHRTQEVNNAQHIYDMIVVGGGPGGYTAALYAARAGMDTVVLEKLSAGGQMALTEQIDNYPGFEDGIDGFSLGEKMKRGTERFGVETKLTEVLSLELSGSVKKAKVSTTAQPVTECSIGTKRLSSQEVAIPLRRMR